MTAAGFAHHERIGVSGPLSRDFRKLLANGLSAERLQEVAKLQKGCVDVILLPNGMPVDIPASIALDKMSEPEFIAFFQKVEAWLAQTYGYVPEARRAA